MGDNHANHLTTIFPLCSHFSYLKHYTVVFSDHFVKQMLVTGRLNFIASFAKPFEVLSLEKNLYFDSVSKSLRKILALAALQLRKYACNYK